jgi:hypothetical protein
MQMFARFIYLLVSFWDADRRELSRLRQEVRNLEKRNRWQQVIIEGSHRNNSLLRQEVTAQGKALRRLKAGQRQQPKLLVVPYDNAGGRQ